MKKKEDKRNMLVFNLRVGPFDISLLTINNGVLEVGATDGDAHFCSPSMVERLVGGSFSLRFMLELSRLVD